MVASLELPHDRVEDTIGHAEYSEEATDKSADVGQKMVKWRRFLRDHHHHWRNLQQSRIDQN